jgi:hypothetical protein
VHHTIDQVSYGNSDDQIYLAVAGCVSQGFVGFGIAKSGGMHMEPFSTNNSHSVMNVKAGRY